MRVAPAALRLIVDVGEVVAGVVRRPTEAGVFLDLDGTLAPIVARPHLARVVPEAPDVLARLVGRVGVVAVVSGRPSDEVRELVGVDGVLTVGTHGLEDGAPIDAGLLAEIEAIARDVGAWVEPKGSAAAVHFRGLDDPEGAATAASLRLVAVGAAHGLEVVGGKRILELVPSGRPRKGGAVERIVRDRGLRAVVFVGDDVGDLDAFEALGRLRAAGLWTCGVVSGGPETPEVVVAAADLSVPGPAGVVELLEAVAAAIEAA